MLIFFVLSHNHKYVQLYQFHLPLQQNLRDILVVNSLWVGKWMNKNKSDYIWFTFWFAVITLNKLFWEEMLWILGAVVLIFK